MGLRSQTASMWANDHTDFYLCIKVFGRTVLRLWPEIKSSAKERRHKQANKRKGTGLSVETAINPLGKRLQFVFAGRKNATVYFCFQLSQFCNCSEVSVVSVVFWAP